MTFYICVKCGKIVDNDGDHSTHIQYSKTTFLDKAHCMEIPVYCKECNPYEKKKVNPDFYQTITFTGETSGINNV
jgi:hypothetical protein